MLALARSRVLGVDLPRGRDLGPILVAWAASLGVLVFQRDLGTSLLFFGVFVAMLYIATERRSWIIIGGVLFAAGRSSRTSSSTTCSCASASGSTPSPTRPATGTRSPRACTASPAAECSASGSVRVTPTSCPFAKTDFIMAAFGEELGLTGVMALLVLYAIVVERGCAPRSPCRDPFGKLLAAGLSTAVGIQVFVVVGGVMKLIPLTGLTTPFLSYGGSSLVANWALVALLLRVSDAARRPPEAATREVAS